ncbi:MAG: formimidoylglutamase [Chloroherpetonaceae bacterium]|nr:formimidoylglutamase [Chloroherpetonaceae bacterium]MDW8437434.1 formimidoylglutamase [Chloroherpetonaceae bacterium]
MDTLTLFDLTYRPDETLFFKKNDPNDVRFGEVVKTDIRFYRRAKFVILGSPQDEGVRRNGGRVGARKAPDEIRRAFYKLPVPDTISEGDVLDIGDTLVQGSLEQIHERQRQVVEQLLRDEKIVIVLGGGNDIAYPDCKALQAVFSNVMAFNLDAHFDVRADEPRNSGTPYRQLLEENVLLPQFFFEIGSQPFANSVAYQRYLTQKGVAVYPLEATRRYGIDKRFEEIIRRNAAPNAIFWGIDMDSVRASDAPGVSAPSPIGFTAEEICHIASIAGKRKRSKLLEITEVNPDYDIDGRTAKLAALIVAYFIREKATF